MLTSHWDWMQNIAVELSTRNLIGCQLIQVLQAKQRVSSSVQVLVVWKCVAGLLRQRVKEIYVRKK